MKKFLKKLSFAMAIMMSFSLAFPILAKVGVYAGTSNQITVTNFQSTAIKGAEYTITSANELGVTTTVTDPYGRSVTVTGGKFTPTLSGNYKVTYTLDSQTVDLLVTVSSGVAQGTEIKFEDNSQYIVPSKINPNNDGQDTVVILPNPYVVDKDGNVIEDATVTTEALLDSNLISTGTQTIGEVEYKTLTLDKATEGTYTVKYKYIVGGNLIAFTTKTIVADTDYDNDYEFSFNYNTTKPSSAEIGVATKLPSVTATNKTTNDQVNVHYTVKAEITIGTTTTEYTLDDTNNDVITFVDGYFYFTPILDGDYVITYDVTNFAGNTATVSSSSFTIEDVADTVKPVPVPVLPYTLNEQGILTSYIDATEVIVSNSSIDNIFIMPIYATDSANGIVADNLTLKRTIIKSGESTTVFNETEDIETDVANKVILFNADETLRTTITAAADSDAIITVYVNGVAYDITKSQIYVMPEESDLTTGTYNINYNANDAALNGINTKTYQMVVSSSFEDTTAPTITFKDNLPTVMFGTDEITFSKPTATDNKDTRLSVYLTYKTTTGGIESEEKRVDAEDSIITYNETTQKYTLKLTSEYSSATQIEVIAYANDDSYNGTNAVTNLGSTSQTINILYTGDTAPTTFSAVGEVNTAQSLVQGSDIVLPTVTYSDDLVNYLNIKIIVENNGTFFNAFDAEITRNTVAQTLTLENAKFTADLDGTYKITYISTDAGNNITVLFYSVDIAVNPGTLSAAFTGLPTQINNGTAEKDVSFDMPDDVQVYLSSTDVLGVDGDIQILVSGLTNYQTDYENYFIAKEVGTYKIQYVAKIVYLQDIYDGVTLVHSTGDEFLIEGESLKSKIYTINVVDTTGPTANYTEINNYFADLNATGFEKGGSFVLPLPDLESAEDLDLSKSYITIASSSSTTTIYLNETTKLETAQTFTRDDTYTITYNLVDVVNNKTSNSVTLDVGDVEAPVLDIDSDIINEQYNIGDVVTVDLSKISAIDNVDGEIMVFNETTEKYSVISGANITITLKNTTTGATISNDLTSTNSDLNYQFTIETAGEYTLTVAVSDIAGKTATYDDLTFTVSSDDNAGLDTEEVLGIVLIVLSIILLGGVIAYFVISKKNLEKKYK